jgi:hypothetical protein
VAFQWGGNLRFALSGVDDTNNPSMIHSPRKQRDEEMNENIERVFLWRGVLYAVLFGCTFA